LRLEVLKLLVEIAKMWFGKVNLIQALLAGAGAVVSRPAVGA
jgi:hypothetical protein